MNIRKKLLLSNILSLILPIILSVSLGYSLYQSYVVNYWDSIEDMISDINCLNEVEWLMDQSVESYYQEYTPDHEKMEEMEVMEENDQKSDAPEHTPPKKKKLWKSLKKDVKKYGYQIQVVIEDETILDTLTDTEITALQGYGKTVSDYHDYTLSRRNIAAVHRSYEESDLEIQITAISTTPLQHIPLLLGYFILVLLLFLSANLIGSKWISHTIVSPLRKLEEAAKKISEQNYDFEITYKKNDEIGNVYRAFYEMKTQLKQAEQERKQFDADRQQLIRGISHDLRTPLTSIKGYAEGLRDGIASTPEMQERYLQAILLRSQNMESLLETLSDFSRLGNAKYPYHMEQVDCTSYLTDFIQRFTTERGAEQLSVSCQFPETPVRIRMDVREMNRVFENLLENSIRYCRQLPVTVTISEKIEFKQVVLYLEDNGPGVPASELETIFQIFYRGDASRTHFEKGSGVGLAIVRRIVEDHGGTITAYLANPGLGMKLVLPLLEKEEK